MVVGCVRSRVALLVGLLALFLSASCDDGTSPVLTEPPPITPSDETQNVGIPFEDDGDLITLRGHLFGPQNDVGVVLAHMRPNDQRAWFGFAQELADNGYAALTFDFRGYGETGGDEDLGKLDDDLAAALRFLQVDRRKDTVFLIGASMGGTAALVVASQQRVAGVVAVSPPAEFEGLDAVEAVSNITAPKLLVASEDDTEAIGFQDLLDAASEPVDSEVYPGNAHGTNLLQSEHSAALRALILQFLGENSGP